MSEEGIFDDLYEVGVELAKQARAERVKLALADEEEKITAQIEAANKITNAVLSVIPNILAYHASFTGRANETWADRCRFAPTLLRNIKSGHTTPQHVTVRLPGLDPFFMGILFDYNLDSAHFFVGQWTGRVTKNQRPEYTLMSNSSTNAVEMIGLAKMAHAKWMAENDQQ